MAEATPKYGAARFAPSELIETLPTGLKLKRRVPRMRACDEKNEKGKLCAGHLKRWYDISLEVTARLGTAAEVYRCERCEAVYLPHPEEVARTGTLAW